MANHLKYSEMESNAAGHILAAADAKILAAALVRIVHQCGATLEDAAKVLGISRSTALRYNKDFRSECAGTAPPRQSHGGRRNETLSPEEEKDFLSNWLEQARTGGLVTIAPIAEALEKRLGRSVSDVTVYNMLKRNGWRKITPDTKHPKADAGKQEEFKKNSLRSWLPPS